MSWPRDCEICRGRGQVRLPRYPYTTARLGQGTAEVESIGAASRDYPCPECSNRVDENRVAVVVSFDRMILDKPMDGAIEYEIKHASHKLIDQLLRGGYLTVEQRRFGTDELELKVSLGVVAKNVVASLEERVVQRQAEVATEAADEAKRRIYECGSYYTGREGRIDKNLAADYVDEALKAVLADRAGLEHATR